MSLTFHEVAREELEEATEYYEQQRQGLGEEFAQEVENALARVQRHPHTWTRLTEDVRRCRLNRFPYGIVYVVRGDDILIVAIMHLRRKPGYWADRL